MHELPTLFDNPNVIGTDPVYLMSRYFTEAGAKTSSVTREEALKSQWELTEVLGTTIRKMRDLEIDVAWSAAAFQTAGMSASPSRRWCLLPTFCCS